MAAVDLNRRTLIVGAAALPLAGCVVAPYGTYYRPSAGERGTLSRAWCSGAAGPLSRLTVPLESGLQLQASVQDRYRGPGRTLIVHLPLPAGGRYAWGEAPVRVADAASGRTLDLALQTRLRGSLTLPLGAWVDRAALHPLQPAPGATLLPARLSVVGPRDVAPAAFTLDVPPLQVGTTLHAVPPVRLQRVAERGNGPYREPALQTRMDACKASPGAPDCAALGRLGLLSAERRIGPVRWRAQFDHFERRYDGRPVHGEFSLDLDGTEPWRWAAEGFAMADAGDGKRHLLEPGSLQLSYDDALVPGAAFAIGGTAGPAQHGNALLALEASLPDDLADISLALPDLTANGRAVALPALRFERRRFDGGIEPFNC